MKNTSSTEAGIKTGFRHLPDTYLLFVLKMLPLHQQITLFKMLSINKIKPVLPPSFQKYFWDVAFDELSFEKYPGFIAERLLNYGDLNAIKWLLSCTNKQFIKSLIENNRNLNAKTKNFWQIMLT